MIPNCPHSARIPVRPMSAWVRVPVRPMPEQDPKPSASGVFDYYYYYHVVRLSHWRQWRAGDYGTQVYEKNKC